MIGVIAQEKDRVVVNEFFELFKTPWEFYSQNTQYEVVVAAEDFAGSIDAPVALLYAGRQLAFDEHHPYDVLKRDCGDRLRVRGRLIPLYGESASFKAKGAAVKSLGENILELADTEGVVVRIGYDLFEEVRMLLESGQPTENALYPALDDHISLMRELIVSVGGSFVEIPPVPAGHQFIVCLTHDVDHPLIRRHRFDRTALGFVARATIGSLLRFARGSLPLKDLLTNWFAALRLPFVQCGLARDFWRTFRAYRRIEQDVPSTFFVIPFSGEPGQTKDGTAPSIRAAGYAARDISSDLNEMTSQGCEVGLHGLDAWRDPSAAQAEIDEVEAASGSAPVGSRMHWLYFDSASPERLETAGLRYDSTVGYNEAVGYRAGTSQAYKPLDADLLLELPLLVMDTALFYPDRLNVSTREAELLVRRIIDTAQTDGGCFTVNWHDRSIAPERLWGDFYSTLLDDCRERGAWFATASDAVAWFRKRRSVPNTPEGFADLKEGTTASPDGLPGLQLRHHGAAGGALAHDRHQAAHHV